MSHVNLALKEWAVTVEALESGLQTLVLRKGGIGERRFFVPDAPFLLYPTGFHQHRNQLKPQYEVLLERANAKTPPQGQIVIRSVAHCVAHVTTQEPSVLERLCDLYVPTHEAMRKRYLFRPEQQLHLLVLRVSRLKQPMSLPILQRYSGCVSWIKLAEEAPMAEARPVLHSSELADAVARVQDAVL